MAVSALGLNKMNVEDEINFVFEYLLETTMSGDSSSSESESDFSDEELLSTLENTSTTRRKRTRFQNFVEETVIKYREVEFVKHFRLQRRTVYKIIEQMEQSNIFPKNPDGREKISIEKSFLMFLWYLGNMETYRQIEDRFIVSHGSISRVLRRVIKYFLSIKSEIIRWPTLEECQTIARTFQKAKGFPNVMGTIDASHIEIPKPREHQDAYCNRKGYHSLLLQGVVDYNKKFIDVFCGEPGSMNDARLLRKSGLYLKFQENPDHMEPFYLIGDSAYPNLNWLVTPFADTGNLTPQQIEFNYRLSATRIVVENAFGLLKGRFRRLRKLDNINMHLCSGIIMASSILHNICISRQDIIETEGSDFNQPSNEFDASYSGKKQQDIFKFLYNNS